MTDRIDQVPPDRPRRQRLASAARATASASQPEEMSVGELVFEVSDRATVLVREEIELAKTEVTEKLNRLLQGGGHGHRRRRLRARGARDDHARDRLAPERPLLRRQRLGRLPGRGRRSSCCRRRRRALSPTGPSRSPRRRCPRWRSRRRRRSRPHSRQRARGAADGSHASPRQRPRGNGRYVPPPPGTRSRRADPSDVDRPAPRARALGRRPAGQVVRGDRHQGPDRASTRPSCWSAPRSSASRSARRSLSAAAVIPLSPRPGTPR